jgi:pimeloyl-ACP methyl ester carboxylesterase
LKILPDHKPENSVETVVDLGPATVSVTSLLAPVAAGRTAPDVVLVPGFTGSKEDFYPFMQLIADGGYNVFAYSQRGQFELHSPAQPRPANISTEGFTLSDFSHDVVALADKLELERPHLLGHSFGGVVAIDAALSAPSRFSSLTLWNSGPVAQPGHEADIDALLLGGVEGLWELRYPRGARSPEETAWLHRRMLNTAPGNLLGAATILKDQVDRSAELRAAGLPILVAHGASDNGWPIAVQRTAAIEMDARYAVIPNAGHIAQADNAAGSAQALLQFWTSIDRREAGSGEPTA